MNRGSRTMDTFCEILQDAKELRDDLNSCINEAVKNFIKNNEEMILQSAFFGFSERIDEYSRNLDKAIEDLEDEYSETIEQARATIDKHNKLNPEDRFDSYDEMSGLLNGLFSSIQMAQTHPEIYSLGCKNFDEALEKLDFRPNAGLMESLETSIQIIQDETGFW